MKKKNLAILALVVALGAGAAYWYRSAGHGGAPADAKAAAPVPVVIARAMARDLPQVLEVVGRAEAYETVSVRSRVDGQVAGVLFAEGRHVNQGDELLRLDATDFTLRLRQAEAAQARDEAQLARAKADTARYQALRERNFVSAEKVNEVRANEQALAATVLADKAAVELARAQLAYTSIRAPFAGVTGARLVFPGAAVKANETELLVINRVRPLHVAFSMPEKYLPTLRRAMAKAGEACRREGCLSVAVSVPGDARQADEGRLRFVDNAVDAATGTIQLKAVLDNKDETFTPGQFLNLSLTLDTLTGAVVVPSEAVQQGPEGPFVFLVDARNVAEVRRVEVGASYRGLTAIAKGLAVGDNVVTDGQLRLMPGASIVASRTDAAAGAPAARPQ